MLVKYQKYFLKCIVLILIITICTIGYRYYCGWLLVRQAADNISNMIVNENCLASEKIYTDGIQLYSMQDKAKEYLESLGTSKHIDFDIVGSSIISTNSDTPIHAWYNYNGTDICPNSYLNAAQKGTMITVKVTGVMRFTLTIMPKWDNSDPYIIEIPITITRNKNALDFYKGQEDSRDY